MIVRRLSPRVSVGLVQLNRVRLAVNADHEVRGRTRQHGDRSVRRYAQWRRFVAMMRHVAASQRMRSPASLSRMIRQPRARRP